MVLDERIYCRPDGVRFVDASPLRLLPCITSTLPQIGYGRVQGHIIDGLEAAGGIKLMNALEFDWDYRLFFGWPRSWWFDRGDQTVQDAIIHTMWEQDKMPEGWETVLNRARLVWVPSHWVRDVFRDGGVSAPIMISGYGVDTDEFPHIQRNLDNPFTFVTIGHSLFDRKGAFQVWSCFVQLKAKGELGDARLLVKLQKGVVNESWFKPNGKDAGIKDEQGNKIEGVSYHFGTMNQHDYAILMAKAHVLVYPQRGEGFGLIPLEFMATGGAVMVTDYSGCKEYIDQRQMIVLPKDVQDEALMENMVWAYRNRDEVRRMGEESAQRIRAEWTWGMAGIKARKLLYEHLGR